MRKHFQPGADDRFRSVVRVGRKPGDGDTVRLQVLSYEVEVLAREQVRRAAEPGIRGLADDDIVAVMRMAQVIATVTDDQVYARIVQWMAGLLAEILDCNVAHLGRNFDALYRFHRMFEYAR